MVFALSLGNIHVLVDLAPGAKEVHNVRHCVLSKLQGELGQDGLVRSDQVVEGDHVILDPEGKGEVTHVRIDPIERRSVVLIL